MRKRRMGSSAEIIAAILLVETHFGSYTGKTPTFAIFSTFAIMDRKANRDKVWNMLPPHERQKWGRDAFDMKLIDRSGWAYKELCALMELRDTHGIRPESLRGSVMGAIGWPQFLPSSLVKYGADGNGDGRIDLYEAEDAIFSTANYLRGHGWCEAKSPSEKGSGDLGLQPQQGLRARSPRNSRKGEGRGQVIRSTPAPPSRTAPIGVFRAALS